MKSIIIALFLIVLAPNVYAQDNFHKVYTTHMCDTYANMLLFIETKFNEKTLFTGYGVVHYEDAQVYTELNGAMNFFVNQDTGTWSMIYIFDENHTCIIADGSNFKPY